MVAMFENFVSVTQEEDVPQVRKPLMVNIVHIVPGILHWYLFSNKTQKITADYHTVNA